MLFINRLIANYFDLSAICVSSMLALFSLALLLIFLIFNVSEKITWLPYTSNVSYISRIDNKDTLF